MTVLVITAFRSPTVLSFLLSGLFLLRLAQRVRACPGYNCTAFCKVTVAVVFHRTYQR
jgi:hypothetical protein